VPRRLRLDAELVRRGLARSRGHAAELIDAGRVQVSGAVARKAATAVATDVALVVAADDAGSDFVSRGGHKLEGALAAFVPRGLRVRDRSCLDAGASTGGFTDVLLRSGARDVVAVDVGYGQLAWPLRQDPRVRVLDRTNVRDLTAEGLGSRVDLVVGDLSFISLTLVLDPLIGVVQPDGDLVLMVKPQFEVGKDRVGKGGVVRDPAVRADAVVRVAEHAAARGWGPRAVTPSPLPGPSGNVEFFLWLRHGPALVDAPAIRAEVVREEVVRAEPSEPGAPPAEEPVLGVAPERVGP
jgi:23S rRNA (cytidine1920-2'-O)/16S rRNA (cytidine1409-2'-O)-methyltransferase